MYTMGRKNHQLYGRFSKSARYKRGPDLIFEKFRLGQHLRVRPPVKMFNSVPIFQQKNV